MCDGFIPCKNDFVFGSVPHMKIENMHAAQKIALTDGNSRYYYRRSSQEVQLGSVFITVSIINWKRAKQTML